MRHLSITLREVMLYELDVVAHEELECERPRRAANTFDGDGVAEQMLGCVLDDVREVLIARLKQPDEQLPIRPQAMLCVGPVVLGTAGNDRVRLLHVPSKCRVLVARGVDDVSQHFDLAPLWRI